METTKELYQQKVDAQINEWGARVDVLKAKAEKATVEAKIEIHKQAEELTRLQETARKQYDELKAASADKWEAAKHGVEEQWQQLSGAVETLWKKIS